MTDYTTKAFTVKDVTVTISKKAKSPSAGDRLEAFLLWLHDNWVDPGYGHPEGRPPRPDQGLPGSGARPDNSLPGSQPGPDQGLPNPPPGGRPDNSLPGSQPGPDNSLPGSGARPDQGLPGEQPGIDNSLPEFIGDNAKELAKAILEHCVNCNTAQPK
jgi:hypothetical protein